MDISANGKASTQLSLYCASALIFTSLALSIPLALSPAPCDWGWYTHPNFCLIPNIFSAIFIISAINAFIYTEGIGEPKSWKHFFTQILCCWSSIRTFGWNCFHPSTNSTNHYKNISIPRTRSVMSMWSIIRCLNGPSEGGICANGAVKAFLTLYCPDTMHSLNTLSTVAAKNSDHHTAWSRLTISSLVHQELQSLKILLATQIVHDYFSTVLSEVLLGCF